MRTVIYDKTCLNSRYFLLKKPHFYLISSQKAGDRDRQFLNSKEKDFRKGASKERCKVAQKRFPTFEYERANRQNIPMKWRRITQQCDPPKSRKKLWVYTWLMKFCKLLRKLRQLSARSVNWVFCRSVQLSSCKMENKDALRNLTKCVDTICAPVYIHAKSWRVKL